MRLHRTFLTLGVLLFALNATPASAPAQSPPKIPTLIVKNASTYPIWVTIYSATITDIRSIVCSGWADPGKSYHCTFVHFSSFPTYYARAEIMQHGKPRDVLCDTTGKMYGHGSEKVSILRYSGGRSCWLDRGQAS